MKSSYVLFMLIALLGQLSLGCSKPITTTDPLKPNILLICVDDLRPELKSFGADYIHSPNIDALARQGVAFQRHYVNAPSCGPSRFTLLMGRYGPRGNNALFLRAQSIAENPDSIPPSMPEWFRTHGYETVSVGKVSHHPGGWGGEDWNDSTIVEMPGAWDQQIIPVAGWQHPRGVMHGLAHGEIRVKAGDMDIYQSAPGSDTIYPDGLITEAALGQLQRLASDEQKPFFLAVGLIKPHLPFGAPAQYMKPYDGIVLPAIDHPQKPEGQTTWHQSGEFMKYNRWNRNPNEDEAFAEEVRRHYAACVTYADAQIGKLLQTLDATGQLDNTIVLLWGDHGWHLGEHAIWGKHSLFEESLHSPLIIRTPGMDSTSANTNAIVETLDIFPTLCDLAGVPAPAFAQGQSLKSLIDNPQAEEEQTAFAYWRKARTVRTDTHRIILHDNGGVELYDHTSPQTETVNIASKHPELVATLKSKLETRFR